MLLGALVVLAILGGILLGGIFTIVLVPFAIIALVAAVGYSIAARAAQPREDTGSAERPLPTGQQTGSGRVRTSPERLADARRVRQ